MENNGFLNRKRNSYTSINREEMRVMVEHAPTRKSKLIVRTLWYTGARISEIVGANGIRPCDIEQTKKELTIRRLKRRKKFEQVIPLDFDLMMALLDYAKSEMISQKRPFFPGHRNSAWNMIREIGEKALSRKVSPKAFRHGKVYDMVSRGIHPLLISSCMGHATPGTVMNYYHPSTDDQIKAFS